MIMNGLSYYRGITKCCVSPDKSKQYFLWSIHAKRKTKKETLNLIKSPTLTASFTGHMEDRGTCKHYHKDENSKSRMEETLRQKNCFPQQINCKRRERETYRLKNN